MGFSMFSAQSSPIAIDFGTSSVKLLQLSLGDRPTVVAAAALPIVLHHMRVKASCPAKEHELGLEFLRAAN